MFKRKLLSVCCISLGVSVLGTLSAVAQSFSDQSAAKADQGVIDIGGKEGVVLNGKNKSISIGGGAVKLNSSGIHIGDVPNDLASSTDNPAKTIVHSKATVTEHYKNGHGKGFGGIGNFNLKNMTIAQETGIVGSLYAYNSTLNGVGVVGPANFDKVTINKEAGITGPAYLKNTTVNANFGDVGELTAIHSSFNKSIAVNGGPVYFNHSTAKNIAITSQGQPEQSEKNKANTQVIPNITLTNHSVVQNITFSAGNGVVLVKDGSELTGKVSGGRVVHQKS